MYKIEPYSDKHWELLGNLGRVMAAHKHNVILTPVMMLAKPSITGGAVRYNFSLLDKWVETFQRAGVVGTIEGGHLLSRSGGFFTPMVVPAYVIEGGQVVSKPLETDDPRAEQFLDSFLTALYAHLKEKGWEKRFVLYISAERFDHQPPIRQQMKALCDMIRGRPVDPHLDGAAQHAPPDRHPLRPHASSSSPIRSSLID